MSGNEPVRIFLCEFDSGTFGYDAQVISPAATVGDYLDAVEAFQARTLADCYGCDGCCHERVPLTIADFCFSEYYQNGGRSLAEWLAKTNAELAFFGEAADLQLSRKPDGACAFLNEDAQCCAKHQFRTFACRSHCCLPKSERAEALRAAIINTAEDELLRRLLAELSAAGQADFLPGEKRLAAVNAADYAENAFSALPAADWRGAKLAEIVEPELWRQLTEA